MSQFIDSIRRTTITTYNIERSLTFYRDTLGMTIWYDGVFDDPAVQEVYDLPDNIKTRVFVLKADSETDPKATGMVAGMIGLLHFEGLPKPRIPEPVRRPLSGEVVILLTTSRMRALELKLTNKNCGFTFLGPPIKLDTPGRSVVYELLGRDPNGVRLSFAQQSEIGPSLV